MVMGLLHPDCINVAILSLSCTSFVKYDHWRKLGKVYRGSFCIISYDFMSIYNYLKMKQKITERR